MTIPLDDITFIPSRIDPEARPPRPSRPPWERRPGASPSENLASWQLQWQADPPEPSSENTDQLPTGTAPQQIGRLPDPSEPPRVDLNRLYGIREITDLSNLNMRTILNSRVHRFSVTFQPNKRPKLKDLPVVSNKIYFDINCFLKEGHTRDNQENCVYDRGYRIGLDNNTGNIKLSIQSVEDMAINRQISFDFAVYNVWRIQDLMDIIRGKYISDPLNLKFRNNLATWHHTPQHDWRDFFAQCFVRFYSFGVVGWNTLPISSIGTFPGNEVTFNPNVTDGEVFSFPNNSVGFHEVISCQYHLSRPRTCEWIVTKWPIHKGTCRQEHYSVETCGTVEGATGARTQQVIRLYYADDDTTTPTFSAGCALADTATSFGDTTSSQESDTTRGESRTHQAQGVGANASQLHAFVSTHIRLPPITEVESSTPSAQGVFSSETRSKTQEVAGERGDAVQPPVTNRRLEWHGDETQQLQWSTPLGRGGTDHQPSG